MMAMPPTPPTTPPTMAPVLLEEPLLGEGVEVMEEARVVEEEDWDEELEDVVGELVVLVPV
jgi:hypothetical protein